MVASALDDVKNVPAGNPLPHLIHAELSAAQLGAGRLIVVGDVHGCPDELKILLRKCQFRRSSDTLAFNGDILNKGPKSVQVSESSNQPSSIACEMHARTCEARLCYAVVHHLHCIVLRTYVVSMSVGY